MMTESAFQVALALINRLDVSIVVKTTIVLTFGLAALPIARGARASVRHLLLATTFAIVLVLPIVISTAPTLTIHLPAAAERVTSMVPTALASANSVVLRDGGSSGGALGAISSLVTFLRYAWAAGAMLLLIVLAIDLQRLRALRRRGLPWLAWNDLARSIAVTNGVRRDVDVLLHEGVSAPLTCGLWRPAILFPIDACEWQDADVRRALVHELEHVRRYDWATQLVARLVCACYWFHPLVWMAWARLRLEAERACDDAVVQRTEGTEYAAQLVGLARRLAMPHALPTIAMANRSDLSARVVAVLDGTRPRGPAGYCTTASIVGVACLLMVLVTSVRAIAARPASSKADHSTQRAPQEVVAHPLSHVDARGRDSVVRLVARPNPKRAPNRPALRPIDEPTTERPGWMSNAPSTHTGFDKRIGVTGSDASESTGSNSSEAIATSSASASSSSETNGRRNSNQQL
jgi:beta-lactamase regulating signal transducer with metallopeptidase domain